MKKIFRLLLILSAAVSAASCGPKGPEVSTAIVNEWHLISISGQTSVPEVYMNFAQDLSFELYQKIGEGRFRKYDGTYTVTETLVSGVYSDGKEWGSSYEASFDENENLVLTAQNGSAEVCTYEKKALSDTDKADAILVTKSSEEDEPRFL